ncbi:hypothetical protein Gogos_020741 [Gossypium gossypioides]|uniref:Uncharacterized protein n=1 Tax=Gossypium gossypioides TaxID=34282 RepID=A0A7J9CZJ8_GOSGO|nr:hypothetical protein [Gossypium gossypioides]
MELYKREECLTKFINLLSVTRDKNIADIS